MSTPICAECGGPGQRVFAGSVESIGHVVERRNNRHPFRLGTPPRSGQERTAGPVLASAAARSSATSLLAGTAGE
jgi:hypothetical protein